MIPDPYSPAPSDPAQLVAYLDGELPEAEARVLAAKISRSPSTRREVEALQGTWDLLDFLHRPQAPVDFSSRTLLALRGVPVADDVADGDVGPPPVRPFARLGVPAAATLLMAVLGFAATRWATPEPGARLADQLSLAKHLDDYRDVGTIEFLQRLDKSPEFDDEE